MTDLAEALRAECRTHCKLPTRPDGPTLQELAVLERELRWRAAAEIDRLRCHAAASWQPMDNAPKDGMPVLLFCPGLNGNVVRGIVVGAWRFDPNRRSLGYWVSDVGHLDTGVAETGPWIEYPELQPSHWAPLTPPDEGLEPPK
jgi:hypothetical protein